MEYIDDLTSNLVKYFEKVDITNDDNQIDILASLNLPTRKFETGFIFDLNDVMEEGISAKEFAQSIIDMAVIEQSREILQEYVDSGDCDFGIVELDQFDEPSSIH